MLKKTKRFSNTYLLLITTIMFLNFLGVSYAHWEHGLGVITNITTTNLKPRFFNGHVDGKNKGLTISVKDEHIRITGKVDYDYSWNDFHYKIQNKSDLPIRVLLPDKVSSQKLYKNDVVDLNVPLEEMLYYEIICEQATD